MNHKYTSLVLFLATLALSTTPLVADGGLGLVNWESPHVHPLDRTPDGRLLVAVNTADNRLEIFQLPDMRALGSIPVGLDPVSVRVRNNKEAWVVNHISDSVTIVDLQRMMVMETLQTDDEPADVVFAGHPEKAYVSCSQSNTILVFRTNKLDQAPLRIPIKGEDPRALAVSPDGKTVYAAVFESGNSSTLVSGGFLGLFGVPPFPQGANDPENPNGGVNPFPNNGDQFEPAINPELPPPPPVGIIVKKDEDGNWRDDNGKDWTDYVSGANAEKSGRIPGWDVLDHDLVMLDTRYNTVEYVDRLMNINMALAVNPANGKVSIVGTDARNEVRYEPVLNGVFLRVNMATVDPKAGRAEIQDLNPHLDYTTTSVAVDQRMQSIGDPRAVVWDKKGENAYVAGMGSNNVVVMREEGGRDHCEDVIAVGEGPTGLVLDRTKPRLYVLNRFDASISVVDTLSREEINRVAFFDPTPMAIKIGRKHLYNTFKNSGLGIASCGSCHVDGRADGLAWDLGDPSGAMETVEHQNLGFGHPVLSQLFADHHPMKGPMVTQTLQDIIGKEPLHWRGDKDSLADFNGAFENLQGATKISDEEMAQFSDFLATLHFPPNPYRGIDNSLPTNLPLTGQLTTRRLGEPGLPLPNGNAKRGLELFQAPNRLAVFGLSCNNCHSLPTGLATPKVFDGQEYVAFTGDDDGFGHHGLVSGDGQSNVTIKVPQLRNLYEKVGMEFHATENTRGFGFSHDGAVWSMAQILSSDLFLFTNNQDKADVIAFLMSFSGSDLPSSSGIGLDAPPGSLSQDTHAGVGKQVTIHAPRPSGKDDAYLTLMMSEAKKGRVGLVARTPDRGFVYRNGQFYGDQHGSAVNINYLLGLAKQHYPVTFTVVPKGTEVRIGLDRDADGVYDGDDHNNKVADNKKFNVSAEVSHEN